jgi:hypothetical protein
MTKTVPAGGMKLAVVHDETLAEEVARREPACFESIASAIGEPLS